ncbi:MAG: zf-HC2 domain-containing protein [Syntrophaceae bacterium]|nr:zf-HC2 domain-containing protein [Syntrophaceae bacterium]
MMKEACSAISTLLERYFDQEVTDEERSLVESHLSECHACQDRLATMEKLRNLVKAPVEEALKKEDFQSTWERIERGIHSARKPAFWESLGSWFPTLPHLQKRVWVPALAAAVILLAITLPLLFKKTPSHPSLSVVQYVESQTYNVMVYEPEKTKVTVIWLFEGSETERPSS